MIENVLFDTDQVDFLRTTLLACQVYLYATDQAESQRKMMPETRPSSLTKEVIECLEMVEDTLKQYLVDKRDRVLAAEEVPLPEYYEDEDE